MPPTDDKHAFGSAPDPSNWSEYRMFVIETLRGIESEQHEIRDRVTNLQIRVAVWSAIWGLVGGCLPLVFAYMIKR